jgi:hypothetical protein
MSAPLIRTLEQAESFDRAKLAAERLNLIALGVRRGWISFPNAESDPPRHSTPPATLRHAPRALSAGRLHSPRQKNPHEKRVSAKLV